MGKKMQNRRLMVFAALLCAAFVGLGYRLTELQVLRHEELRAKAERNTQRELILEPRRGNILDAPPPPLVPGQTLGGGGLTPPATLSSTPHGCKRFAGGRCPHDAARE